MSTQGLADLSGVDPGHVPATRVVGPAVSVPMPTDRLATVRVPTDAGVYEVLLSRSPQQPVWVVERITSPQGQG
jgi:hypothetical protein